MKKNVLLVADLIAAMQVRDGSGTDLLTGSQLGGGVGGVLGSLAASLLPKSLDLGQPLLNPTTSFSAPPSVPLSDPNSSLDASDMSRKRCASSVAGDRVQKALKLEPQDDLSPLPNPPPSMGLHSSSLPPPLPSTHTFSFTHTGIPVSMAPITEQTSLSASVPSSRPPSPPRLLHSSLGIPQDTQMANATMSGVPYPSMDATSLSQADFASQVPPTTMLPPPIPGFMGPSPTGAAWPEPSVSVPIPVPVPVAASQHRHSLSGGSLGSLTRPNLNLAGSTSIAYVQGAGPYISPTRSTHPSASASVPLPPISATASGHPTLRTSRSGSFSHAGPFAFSVPQDIAPPPPPIPDAMRSRPSTAGMHSGTRPSSPEWDNDDDLSDSPQGYYSSSPPRDDYKVESGDPSMEGVQSTSRPRTGGRRPSRTSPEGGGYVTHTNEVPQEYRPAVERIFFEFLNNVCSNRKSLICSGFTT